MAILSVSLPNELKHKMNELDIINWSAVARHAFEEKVKEIEFLKKIAKKSKLSEEDAKKISDKISKKMSSKFKKIKCKQLLMLML